MVGQVLTKTVYFAGIVLATRALGVENWGLFTACISAGLIVITFVNLGLNPYVTREVAAGRRSLPNMFRAAGRYRAVASLAYLLVVPPVLHLTVPDATWPVVTGIALYLIVDSWAKYFFAQLRGAENTHYEVVGLVSEKAVVLATAALALFWARPDRALSLVTDGFVLAASLKLAVAAIGGRRILKVPIVPLRGLARGMMRGTTWRRESAYLRDSAPFLFIAIFTSIYFRIDSYMLASMVGNALAGQYGAAYKLLEGLMFAPGAVMAVYSPMLVKTLRGTAGGRGRDDRSPVVIGRIAALQTTIVSLLGLGLVLEHQWLVVHLYGSSFMPASRILLWLAPAFLAMGLNFLLGGILTADYRQNALLKITAVGAVANVALNLYAIPRYGALGAAIDTVLTEGGIGLAMAVVVRKALPLRWLVRPILRVESLLALVVAAPVLLLQPMLSDVARIALELGLALLSIAALVHLSLIPNPLKRPGRER